MKEIIKASSKVLLKKQREPKRPYISQETWASLERKWEAIDNRHDSMANQLSQEIKERVRKGKEIHLLEELQQVTEKGYRWDGFN